MATITYLEAIREALREEMRRDPGVFVLGEDIGIGGGAFGITKGFLQEFGRERVLDTPLAESGFIGVAIGTAILGLRPVVELQFADFVTDAYKMIVDFAACHHYHQGEPLPLTLRLPSGSLGSAGAFHSHNPEGWFFHSPGLKIVSAASPYDAKGLLLSAIRDNNPVLFLEYKKLYNLPPDRFPPELARDVPEGEFTVPIGEGQILREGRDLTLLTFGLTVFDALEAADRAGQDGVDIEVIDLRSIRPFDKDLILESVRKTGRVLIAHEDHRTGGVGAEWAAFVAGEAFHHLDAPVERVGALDVPIPFSPPLEAAFLPNPEKILAAVHQLAAY
ncbi:MAG: alpha-ketoacid dehydrogenase subunit beta [Nitrospinota bacterium]